MRKLISSLSTALNDLLGIVIIVGAKGRVTNSNFKSVWKYARWIEISRDEAPLLRASYCGELNSQSFSLI